jgi:hypothetical protein
MVLMLAAASWQSVGLFVWSPDSKGFEQLVILTRATFRSWDSGRRQKLRDVCREEDVCAREQEGERLSLFDPLMQFVVDIAPNQ